MAQRDEETCRCGGRQSEECALDGWIEVETSASERLIALSASGEFMRQYWGVRHAWLGTAWMAGCFLIYAVLSPVGAGFGEIGWAVFSTALLLVIVTFIMMRRAMWRKALAGDPVWRCRVGEEGLEIDSGGCRALWQWSSMAGLRRRCDALLVYLVDGQVLFFPARCFVAAEVFDRWVVCLERLSGHLSDRGLRIPASPAGKSGWQQVPGDFCQNLLAGLGFLLFRRAAAERLRLNGGHLVYLTLAWLLVRLAGDFSYVASLQGVQAALEGSFWTDGLLSALAIVLLVQFFSWRVTQGIASARPLAAFFALALPLWWVALIREVLGLSLPVTWQPILAWFLWSWAFCAGSMALIRVLEIPLRCRVIAAGSVMALFAAVWLMQADNFSLWAGPQYEDEGAANAADAVFFNESALYAQPRLLEMAQAAVQPGHQGVPELYLLAFAGDGGQNVFLHEVESVATLFSERLGAGAHSIILANSPESLDRHPMATTIALRESLRDIGKKMNRDEDVLFLFLTSHGAQDHHFSLELGPYFFNELTPPVLRTMLDEAGIKNRVIMVSACYSGGFIPDLADAHTLVMSASRADRSSHGCQQGADWTFFGRAYFNEALRHTHSFEKAFGEARSIVAAREKQEGVTPSEPQIAVGSDIRPALARLEKALQQQQR